MSLEDYEEIEKIIKSAVGRVVHEEPSKRTLQMMDEMNKSRAELGRKIETTNIELNQKIDNLISLVEAHNIRHEQDMEDMRPIIQNYKDRQVLNRFAKDYGELVKWVASIFAALTVLWLFVKGFFRP